jgi:SAM-dependent methyltransferase
VTIKDLVRPLPGVRQLSLMRQRIGFGGSADYWEQNYTRGENSGPGSYGVLAAAKAEFLNTFVRDRAVASVIEFGCGDGHQLSLARYPRYVGLDVSRSAVRICRDKFAADPSKSFFLYDGDCFVDRAGIFVADLAMSLDVIYHLVEDAVFEAYMADLFAASRHYVVIYASNTFITGTAPHVRHREFSVWVDQNCPQWRLTHVEPGISPEVGRADFFVYERTVDEVR